MVARLDSKLRSQIATKGACEPVASEILDSGTSHGVYSTFALLIGVPEEGQLAATFHRIYDVGVPNLGKLLLP
jgi:hypothetical protein